MRENFWPTIATTWLVLLFLYHFLAFIITMPPFYIEGFQSPSQFSQVLNITAMILFAGTLMGFAGKRKDTKNYFVTGAMASFLFGMSLAYQLEFPGNLLSLAISILILASNVMLIKRTEKA